MIQELMQYIKRHKWLYLLVFIALMVDYSLTIIPTMVTQRVIDAIAMQHLTVQLLNEQLLLLIVTTILFYITEYIWIKYLYSSSARFKFELRMRLFNKLIRMRVPFYEKFRSGDMMTRFTNDINDVSELLGYGSMSLLFGLGTILFVVPAMFTISIEISLMAMLPIIILGVIVFYVGKWQEKAMEESREAVASLSNEVLEVVEGIRVTRAYGKKELGASRFRKRTSELATKANAIMKYGAIYGRIANTMLAISTIIVLGVGGYYMQQGNLTLGKVVALQMYTLMLMEPMWVLSDFILVYQASKVAFGKISELLSTSDDMEEDGELILDQPEVIEFKNYDFKYANSEQNVLKQINIRLEKGKTLGIVGKTGSGKTTLVRQLLRQYPVGSGNLLINGQPVTDYQRSSVEAQIGYVPQEHILFSRTVQANIEVGKANASRKEIDYSVAAASFTQDLERMSEGYETLVGEKGVSISGGQKQRISIARAFIKDPNVLILDDSLSAVDARTERIIIENIQALRQGKTNIIVTHRLSAVNHADWVIVLDEGRIIEEGTPAQLLAQKGWYYEQHERQQLEGESA
ncbi:ABC transporter ATP-binding protein/permease [Aerococcaceae bacterium NML190073]|nr:ABC transporter ATP-binding protein/permease [Aerococcaceae bacterium NML190073]MCW6665171.1 ABC transporter ATP-binding protein/permease [Aerococcaceae bacterium NML191219]MCW6680650.1 ABC transporter ATP-binding protein/permease [Aerococcaceae bacterium NML130460]